MQAISSCFRSQWTTYFDFLKKSRWGVWCKLPEANLTISSSSDSSSSKMRSFGLRPRGCGTGLAGKQTDKLLLVSIKIWQQNYNCLHQAPHQALDIHSHLAWLWNRSKGNTEAPTNWSSLGTHRLGVGHTEFRWLWKTILCEYNVQVSYIYPIF